MEIRGGSREGFGDSILTFSTDQIEMMRVEENSSSAIENTPLASPLQASAVWMAIELESAAR